MNGASSERSDLLPTLERIRESGGVVRRTEAWRRRGWSGRRVASAAEGLAGALADRGLGPGDRVALLVGDGPLWHAAFLGTLRAGAVAVPLDLGLGADVLLERAREMDLAAMVRDPETPRLDVEVPIVEISWRESPPEMAPPPPPGDDPDRLAEIVLTSGTTGAPTAVGVTHANLRTVLDALDDGIEPYRRALRVLPRLRLAVSLPLSHLYGQVMGLFVPAQLGADVSLLPPMPAPELARRLREEGAWTLATVPRTLDLLGTWLRREGENLYGEREFARRLDRSPSLPWWRRPLEFLRLRRRVGLRLLAVVSGGAALDREVESLWRNLGYVVVQGYGLTETAPLVTLDHPFDSVPGSLGRPLPGVEVRIANDGEILVRGANVVAEADAVDERGWLHTGDLGRLDRGERLVFLGRKGERIVTPAGVNVDPAPIVEALRSRDEIRDAVVLERPWGEPGAVCAVLLPRPDADLETAVRETNESLPDAARIRAWRAWPEHDFPRTRTGKPRRPAIAAWLADRAADREEDGSDRAFGGDDGAVTGVEGVARLVADVAGLDPGEIDPDVPLGDVLGSLDRVDLVTRLEMNSGVSLGPTVVTGDRTIEEIARAIESGEPSPERGVGPEPVESPPGGRRPVLDRTGPQASSTGGPDRPERTGGGSEPARSVRVPPEARWRARLPVRIARHALRELALRPAWRSLFDARVEGRQRLRGLEPPFLLAANHLSIFDPGAILFGLPAPLRARFAATAMWEHFPARTTGRLEYALGVLGIDLIPLVQSGDWRPTLRIAGRVADRGGCPLVFPEGERSKTGDLLPFRRGVAIMAAELHLPIVPCGIAGTGAALPPGARWLRECWIGRAPVAVRFGRPIEAPGPDEDPARTIDELEERIEDLAGKARSGAGRW